MRFCCYFFSSLFLGYSFDTLNSAKKLVYFLFFGGWTIVNYFGQYCFK